MPSRVVFQLPDALMAELEQAFAEKARLGRREARLLAALSRVRRAAGVVDVAIRQLRDELGRCATVELEVGPPAAPRGVNLAAFGGGSF